MTREIREDDGMLVITDKDVPAGMGRTQAYYAENVD